MINYNYLEKKRKTWFTYFLIFKYSIIIATLIGALLISYAIYDIIDVYSEDAHIYFMVGGSLLGISPFVFFCNRNKILKKISTNIKPQILKDIINEVYKDIEHKYDSKGGFHRSEIDYIELIYKGFDKYETEDYIAGNYKNTFFYGSDVYCYSEYKTSDGTETNVYFNGRIYVINFEDFKHENISMVNRHNELAKVFRMFDSKANIEFDTESIEFNDHFRVYSRSQEKALLALKPQLLDKFVQISKTFGNQVNFCLNNGKLYLLMVDKSDHFEINVRKPINEENLKHLYDEVRVPLDLIDLFKK